MASLNHGQDLEVFKMVCFASSLDDGLPTINILIAKAIFAPFVLKPYKRQSICHGPSSVALASLLRLGFNQRSTVSQDGHSVALPAMTLQSLCVHNVDSASTFLAVSVRVLLFIFDNSN